ASGIAKCYEVDNCKQNPKLKFKFDDKRQTLCSDITADNSRLCTGGSGGYLRVFDLVTEKTIRYLGPVGEMKSRIFAIKYQPYDYGNIVFSGGWDDVVNMWDTRISNGSIQHIHGPHICGNTIDFFNEKSGLISIGSWKKSDSIIIWDLKNWMNYDILPNSDNSSLVYALINHEIEPESKSNIAGHKIIISGGCNKNKLYLYDASENLNILEEVDAGENTVTCLDKNINGTKLEIISGFGDCLKYFTFDVIVIVVMSARTNIEVPPHRRGPIAAEYSSPGPIYNLRSLCGSNGHDVSSNYAKNPSYSFGIKKSTTLNASSPGPCYYPDSRMTSKGKDGSPAFSLHYRPKDVEPYRTPGPGAYSLGQQGGKNSPPVFSFGQKFASRKVDRTPAPNRYSLPSVFNKTVESRLKQSPCITMSSRLATGRQDGQKSPGPASYNVTRLNAYANKGPEFSMGGNRKDILVPLNSKSLPGPGQYNVSNMDSYLNSSNKISFRIKHSPFIAPAFFDVEA
ncbi:MAG: hypothetical protein MHPSP_002930, partial [Paramarteilia canceri]